MDIFYPLIMKVIAGLAVAGIAAAFPFIVRLPGVLKELTVAIVKLEHVLEEKTAAMIMLERRIDVSDQIFSDLADKRVSTRLIAEGSQDSPKFAFKRRTQGHAHETRE